MGALLRGVKREQMKRGQVIIAPGSMKPITKFQAQIYVSTVIVDRKGQSELTYRAGADEGRRHVFNVSIRRGITHSRKLQVVASILL
jgi:translation elongation factor EF-Tu-like GTPase